MTSHIPLIHLGVICKHIYAPLECVNIGSMPVRRQTTARTNVLLFIGLPKTTCFCKIVDIMCRLRFVTSHQLCGISQIARFMGPTWGPPGSCRPQLGPILAPWALLSGMIFSGCVFSQHTDISLCYCILTIPLACIPSVPLPYMYIMEHVAWQPFVGLLNRYVLIHSSHCNWISNACT